MRFQHFIDSGPFSTEQACRAAGIDKNRLALWHHRANFQSDEDLREDRLPGDPRQYTGNDAARMRLLSTLTDAGVPMVGAQAAVRLFVEIGFAEAEPWLCVMTRIGAEWQARAVQPAEIQKVLSPANHRSRPRLAVVVDIESVVNETVIELSLIRVDQTMGRAKVFGWVSSEGVRP